MTEIEKIVDYEQFILALWIWNYLRDSAPAEKKHTIQLVLNQNKSIWEYVRETTMKLPDPRDAKFKECLEFVETLNLMVENK